MARAPATPEEDDDLPVRSNPHLFGHDSAAAALGRAVRSGRLPHAWLVTGPPGIGKATLGYRFARWLLAGAPDVPAGATPLHLPEDAPAFRRIAAAGHADFRVLRPMAEGRVKEEIRVDAVRRAIAFLNLTPAEGGWRFLLVDGAEEMRPEAANAILKTLEEPPPRSVLMLTTPAPDRLLTTIRSRCRRLDLSPLDEADTMAVLQAVRPNDPRADLGPIAALAGGAPGRALALIEEEGLALQKLVDEAIAEAVAAKRDGSAFLTFVELLRRAISGAVRAAARGGAAPAWLNAHPLAEWSTLWDSLGRLAAETDGLSLDRKGAVLTMLGWLTGPRR